MSVTKLWGGTDAQTKAYSIQALYRKAVTCKLRIQKLI